MGMAGKEQVELTWQSISVIQRFSSVLYPLDIYELLREAPTIGYVVSDLALRGTPEINKPVAQKGDIELVGNQDNKTIGVKGRGVDKSIAAFQELQAFYMERLDPSPGLATQYIEFDGRCWAKSGHNPTAVFASFWSDFEPLRELGSVLGEDVSNFGIELVSPNRDPNIAEWFHIDIKPLVPSAAKRYLVRFIWRGPDVKGMLSKFAKIEEILRQLIRRIEKS
jgi:hypothetical protein